ncbi:MAG: sugar ABC transporter permease [Bacillati bacterium ANGP1]|uniref:Xylose transport system permease protein XylH n=1 Tax=Candidatus Segetimicrobium genomatis TaxID=2569760 RepID=A0A537JZT2_9BACT|nr:MAG: sugar ABC transporter permease [Terrabacteria group bacterium ANGP1]
MAGMPESAPAARGAGAIRRRGAAGGMRAAVETARRRIGQGELGPLPVILGLAVIWTFFQVQDHHFLTPRNLSNLILQIAVDGVIAIGVVLVLLLGEIDLSVGSVSGVTAAVLGVLVTVDHAPWWAGILVMLACGCAIGAFQGVWSAVVGVPSFVVTLAGLLGWLGVQLHVLGSEGTLNVVEPHLVSVMDSYLPQGWGWGLAVAVTALYGATRFLRRAQRRQAGLPTLPALDLASTVAGVAAAAFVVVAVLNRWQGVPTAGVILVALVACFAWVTTRTRFGRHIYAIGGNAEAARRAGINVTGVRVAVFTLSSLLAAVGGLLAVSRNQAAGTLTGGGTLLLEAIAAAVIGGTSLFGGRGTVWSALLGSLVIGSVSNGLDLTSEAADVKYIVQGAILLAAVTVDALSRRKRGSALS